MITSLKPHSAAQWATLTLCGLALLLGVAGAKAAPVIGPAWVARYDQPDKKNRTEDVLVDPSGNTYVVFRDFASTNHVNVVKHNAAGRRLWAASYETDGVLEGHRAALDANGNLFVACMLEQEVDEDYIYPMLIVKFGANGAVLWHTTREDPEGGFNAPGDVGVDAAGNLYVAGRDDLAESDGSDDGLLLKLAGSDGHVIWEGRHTGDMETDQSFNSIVIDNNGGIFVAGSTDNGQSVYDFLIAKFDAANGAELWSSTYDGPDGGDDFARRIALSSNGVVVLGLTSADSGNPGPEDPNFATVKYNASDGQQVWVSIYDGPLAGEDSQDEPRDLAVDSAGNVLVTGYATTTAEFVRAFATVKYNGVTGAQTWVALHESPVDLEEEFSSARAIVADSAGNSYVTGTLTVDASTGNATTIKYNAAGQQQWIHSYAGRGLGTSAVQLGRDRAGNAYVAGTATIRETLKDFETEVFVLKYVPTGRGAPVPRIPKPTFTFSESAKDKLVCVREEGETVCDEATTNTFKVTSTATMQDIDITQFDAETPFTLSVGGLELQRTLGDDPRYAAGKTKATIVENILDEDKRARKALTITLSWPKGKFKVSVVSTAYFDGGILASEYLDEPTARITDTTSASVSLGDFTQEFSMAVTGKVTTRPTRDGEFDLSTVTLTGKGTGL